MKIRQSLFKMIESDNDQSVAVLLRTGKRRSEFTARIQANTEMMVWMIGLTYCVVTFGCRALWCFARGEPLE